MSGRARLTIGSAVRIGAIGLFAASMLAFQSAPALSQSAIGGSIGKQDKSISGGGDEGGGSRSTSHERERERERPSHRERERSSHSERSASRSSGGGGGNFNGTWSVASSSASCGSSNISMGISGGRVVSPAGFSGSVSGGGSLHGQFSSNGHTGTFSGHLSSGSGSGSFRRSDGCTGSFSMAKQ